MPHQVNSRRYSFSNARKEREIRKRRRCQIGNHLLQQQFESLIVPDLLNLRLFVGQSIIQGEITLGRADSNNILKPIGESQSDRFQHVANGRVVGLQVKLQDFLILVVEVESKGLGLARNCLS